MAYGKKSREETTREAISSPNDIDLDYDIAIKQVNQKIEKKYEGKNDQESLLICMIILGRRSAACWIWKTKWTHCRTRSGR